jgi:hypothetical protein
MIRAAGIETLARLIALLLKAVSETAPKAAFLEIPAGYSS